MIDLPVRWYVVYDNPSDMPGHIVVRGVSIYTDGRQLSDDRLIAWCFGERFNRTHEAALEAAREHCAGLGLVRIARHPDDDPVIVETWL